MKRDKGTCSNCQCEPVFCKQLCNNCYFYQKHTGRPRPERLWQRPTDRRGGMCINCRIEPALLRCGLCAACSRYERRHGKPRPKRLFMRPERCRNCDAPRNAYAAGFLSRAGLCVVCDSYQRHTGKKRPQHLIRKIAPHGWCECGRPAAGEYRLANLTIDRGKRVEYAERLCIVCAREEGIAA